MSKIISFITSNLPDNVSLQSASLYVNFSDTAIDNNDSISAELVLTSQSSNFELTTADYDALTFNSGGSLDFENFSFGFNQIEFSNTDWVNKTGYTKVGIITSLDIDNIEPTGINMLQSIFFSEESSKEPYLWIEYSQEPEPNQSPVLEISPWNLDFGYDCVYESVTQTMTITNNGLDDLTVYLSDSDNFEVTSTSRNVFKTLSYLESQEIEVIFTPPAVGSYSEFINILHMCFFNVFLCVYLYRLWCIQLGIHNCACNNISQLLHIIRKTILLQKIHERV